MQLYRPMQIHSHFVDYADTVHCQCPIDRTRYKVNHDGGQKQDRQRLVTRSVTPKEMYECGKQKLFEDWDNVRSNTKALLCQYTFWTKSYSNMSQTLVQYRLRHCT